MTKYPLLNALSASAYIGIVVALFHLLEKNLGNKPDTVFAPVVFLSLLTLSVTVMTLCFFYQPIKLYADGKSRQALQLFAQTVGVFALFTALSLAILLSGIL